MGRQFAEQVLNLAFTTLDMNLLFESECGLDQAVGDHLGQAVRNAHRQMQRSVSRSPIKCFLQLFANRKDFIGVAKDGPTGISQDKTTPNPVVQLLPESFFQLLELIADRRLSQVQPLTRGRNARWLKKFSRTQSAAFHTIYGSLDSAISAG